ncbi:cyclic-di-AMP receptor [Lactobacillus rodentium]|uniref:Nitrogen regulatory protein P-II n=1 Tax=Lactobacillus rodentium TaxID=947835 RepID=A0A2Z6T7S8_9LACO|nr:cyclic-di-AMP receptor [Lactobacillus rodentium]MCR1893846.1 cyclic-di-AMP receptor [Lactobacillus rodentium]GBG04288.1 hypothetical protein LrDSM24759_02020 [Lactobacillus rodentium]
MKLIIAIVQNKDADELAKHFIENDIRATKLATSGGFLKAGNTTFMIGISDERVEQVIDLIKEYSHKREQYLAPNMSMGSTMFAKGVEVEVGGATVFVLPVESFVQF